MPYKVEQDRRACPVSKPWAVKNSETGAVVPGGCHPSRDDALKHQRALQANVPDASRNPMGIRSGMDG
jgi:hypothetical protein